LHKQRGRFQGAFAYGAGFHEPIVFLAASTLRTFPKRFFGFLFAAFILPATLSLALTKPHRQIFEKVIKFRIGGPISASHVFAVEPI